MARGSTARATPRRRKPPPADVTVRKADGMVETVTMATWKRRHPRRAAPVVEVPYPLESFLAGSED